MGIGGIDPQFLTSAIDGIEVKFKTHRFNPGKYFPVPIQWEAAWALDSI
jgi:hypothetical protein